MPLQNRVTPFGDIVALAGRGLMMGNRGILHDEGRRIVRCWQVRRWIACRTEFRGRHRTIMLPRSYTELFFLDEATALSAGHRPCAECRHVDYQRFLTSWRSRFGKPVSADIIDARLERDRVAGRKKRTYPDNLAALPDGTYVALDGTAWLVWGSELLAWTDRGYTHRRRRSARRDVEVLTPRSTVAVLADGYRPAVHPTAAI
ncbi:MAG: hypothetical protein GIW99_10295 [Candidatus Eremiobacteraeota bacterium]|nr:hypothetical protein [Candidatus Eremiobacteraeota bacterium]MBC5828051.1 hypothetical protein [Candidatus Eremiobacteraeota bacterium]